MKHNFEDEIKHENMVASSNLKFFSEIGLDQSMIYPDYSLTKWANPDPDYSALIYCKYFNLAFFENILKTNSSKYKIDNAL